EVVYQATPEIACTRADGCGQELPLSAQTASEDAGSAHKVSDTPASAEQYAPRVITADNAYIIGDIMRDVINRGTGGAARVLGRHDLSGKHGTTDDTTNGWLVGFNARLVAVAWVGFDNPQTLGYGETGAHAALPIWIDYMGEALQGVPKSIMPRPDNIVTVS